MNSKFSKLAVLGNPIEHSLSPLVFQLFAKQFDIKLQYDKILITSEKSFNQMVEKLFNQDYIALNVTSPYKHLAANLVNADITAKVELSKAANFISHLDKDRQYRVDTTDGCGLVNDLKYNRLYKLEGKKILIVGSGYVVDSVVPDLSEQNPLTIDILARNQERLDYLTAQFNLNLFKSDIQYDLIINTTPNTPDNELFNYLSNQVNVEIAYDMTYTKTVFLDYIGNYNLNVRKCNGLGMLVEQAKVAFNYVFNKSPDSKEVFSRLLELNYHV